MAAAEAAIELEHSERFLYVYAYLGARDVLCSLAWSTSNDRAALLGLCELLQLETTPTLSVVASSTAC